MIVLTKEILDSLRTASGYIPARSLSALGVPGWKFGSMFLDDLIGNLVRPEALEKARRETVRADEKKKNIREAKQAQLCLF